MRCRVMALAMSVCLISVDRARRVRPIEQLHVDLSLVSAASEPGYNELQRLVGEVLPSDPLEDDLQPTMDELLASNPFLLCADQITCAAAHRFRQPNRVNKFILNMK